MIYYTFLTREAADSANDLIASNVRQWVAEHVPEALSGEHLRSRRASDGAFVDVLTVRWGEPLLTSTGLWVFVAPTQEKTSPIPVEVFVSGIAAEQTPFDAAWFPVGPNVIG